MSVSKVDTASLTNSAESAAYGGPKFLRRNDSQAISVIFVSIFYGYRNYSFQISLEG